MPLLIEPFGIEINNDFASETAKPELLIEPFGIEILSICRAMYCGYNF